MTSNTVSATDHKEVSNLFADFFKSVYQNPIKFNIDNLSHIQDQKVLISDIQITEKEILDAIDELDSKKGSGPDSIPPKFLKNTKFAISKILFKIFNLSLDSGIFYDSWKTSFITPIFKCGNRSQISNYRGIAILNCIPKLFEKNVVWIQ
jgi:hypothetical protein